MRNTFNNGDIQAVEAISISLFVPLLVFYLFIFSGSLSIVITLIVLLSVGGALYLNRRHTRNAGQANRNKSGPTLSFICLLTAFLLTMVGGEGRLLPATSDWFIRDAVLRDLVDQSWPVIYYTEGADFLLRAPLGMYLIPALVGKAGGLYAAHCALWLQNTIGLFIVFRVLCDSSALQRSLTVLMVFCCSGGLEVLPILALELLHLIYFGDIAPLSTMQWWDKIFQYSATLTQIIWVPHHALAGWFCAALLLLWEKREIRISALASGAALSMLWSPFALLGMIPFLVNASWEALTTQQFKRTDVVVTCAIAVALLPAAIYLTTDTGDVIHGFQKLTFGFIIRYALFLLVEIAPFAAINSLFGNLSYPFGRTNYMIALFSLVLIPLYKIGEANDFVMRTSIPALAILAITTGNTIYDIVNLKTRIRSVVALTVIVLGGITGLFEVTQVLRMHNNGISTCNLMRAWSQSPYSSHMSKTTYLANWSRVPFWIKAKNAHISTITEGTATCLDQHL